jgi:hypothetical protein
VPVGPAFSIFNGMITVKRKIRFSIFLLLFLIISPLIILYANGDILNGWGFLKTGGIYVHSAPIGSEIYLNTKLKTNTNFFQRDILIKNLKPGNYEIGIKKDGYNTWSKKIAVSNNVVSDADVFILPKVVELREILPKLSYKSVSTTTLSIKDHINQEYTDLFSIFSVIKASSSISVKDLGTKKYPIMNGKEGLWQDNGKVFVGWFGKENSEPQYLCVITECKKSMLVFDLLKKPTNFDFFPGFDGVIIVAFENQIFAVQLEENADKSTQLIYKGKNPDFRIINGTVYIKDSDFIAEVLM